MDILSAVWISNSVNVTDASNELADTLLIVLVRHSFLGMALEEDEHSLLVTNMILSIRH